ncbi:hypothetical protein AB0E96_10870 [Kitasatospora sp. NPDC036755]|uniref:hypothetical protein n=1 Tax=Kitasatospora sp. NPDC036755 TaxID=3154600 RepID=UPI0033F79230
MGSAVRGKLRVGAVGIGVVVSACYAWASAGDGDADYPLPYKRRDASVLRRIALADPSTRNIAVAADDRTITMEVAWGGCDYRPDLVARESDERVALLLRRRDASGPNVGCEDGGIAELKVVLRRPLGGRTLTDALTGGPVPHARAE